MYSPETTSKIALWREKARNNTLTKDELKEALAALRAGRGMAHGASAAAKARTAKTKTIIDSDDLLSQL